jgi:hydrogenase nickel incorporation protein HypA/HybF
MKRVWMHEQAVTQSILEIVIGHARQAGASSIRRINLVIGEMSGVVDDSVQFYFDFLSQGTMAEGAQLVFDRRPAVYRCLACETTYEPHGYDWICPTCGALTFDVLSGREFRVESIEIEDELSEEAKRVE